MIAYILKSSVSLLLLYGLYWLLLRKEKLFVFNRYFLLFSILFSLVLPFIVIPVNIQTNEAHENIITLLNGNLSPLNTDHNPASDISKQTYADKESFEEALPARISFSQMLLIVYILGLSLTLFRFTKNILNIYRQIKLSESITFSGRKLVLIDNQINPYCFFNTIFVCKNDYLNNKIAKEFLTHELEHIRQSHSIDIIVLELIRIVYWFNPVLYLYSRAIRVNHEYLADNGVINDNSDIKTYTDKLLSFISCSSNMSLTSGSNNSFTKLRLMMMMKSRSGSFKYGARIAVTLCMGTVFFLLLSFKESKSATSLSKEGIVTQQNVDKGIGLSAEKKPQKFQLINASEATRVNNIHNFSGNVIIRIPKTGTNYTLIKSDSATYDKDKNIIKVNLGTMEKYNSGDIDPFEKIYFADLKYDAESGKVIAKKINAVVYFKDNMIDFSGKWVLNLSASKSFLTEVASSSIVISISQDKNSVTMDINITAGDGNQLNRTEKYAFNESVVRKNTKGDNSTVITCTPAPDGQSFTITEVSSGVYNGIAGESKRISVYTLSKDGRNLIIKIDDTPRQGSITPEDENHETRVFDKAIVKNIKAQINLKQKNSEKTNTEVSSLIEKPEIFPIRKGEYGKITVPFGEKRLNPNTKNDTVIYHYGIDLVAKLGTEVMATAGGKVIIASWEKGENWSYGKLIMIDHGDGCQSVYAHLNDFSVKSGDLVTKGQIIGHVGSSGVSTAAHLHFEIRVKGERVNPMTYLKQ